MNKQAGVLGVSREIAVSRLHLVHSSRAECGIILSLECHSKSCFRYLYFTACSIYHGIWGVSTEYRNTRMQQEEPEFYENISVTMPERHHSK